MISVPKKSCICVLSDRVIEGKISLVCLLTSCNIEKRVWAPLRTAVSVGTIIPNQDPSHSPLPMTNDTATEYPQVFAITDHLSQVYLPVSHRHRGAGPGAVPQEGLEGIGQEKHEIPWLKSGTVFP